MVILENLGTTVRQQEKIKVIRHFHTLMTSTNISNVYLSRPLPIYIITNALSQGWDYLITFKILNSSMCPLHPVPQF